MHPESDRVRDTQNEQQSVQQSPMRCATCEIEILWPPITAQGKTYCCAGCAAGGPCSCDYSQYRSTTISGVVHYDGLVEAGPDRQEQSSQP